MAEVLPENGLISSLTGPITAGDLTIAIQSSDAVFWPVSGEYRVVLWQDPVTGPWELVKIVSGQGTATLGVERAAEPYHGAQVALDWPAGTGVAAVITQDGVYALLQAQRLIIQTDEFLPSASATTVTLASLPEEVFMVSRNGVIQSLTAGHYVIAGSLITFAAAFSGNERVIVSYCVRGAPA
jgi:hypothetical protein